MGNDVNILEEKAKILYFFVHIYKMSIKQYVFHMIFNLLFAKAEIQYKKMKEGNTMKRKKGLTLALVISMMSAMLAGCSTGSNGTNSQAPEAETKSGSTAVADGTAADETAADKTAAEKVKLKWALWDLESVAYYKPLVEAYTKENPHVEIEYVDLGSADYGVMLATQLAGGADLDIITNKGNDDYLTNVEKGIYEPLGAFMQEQGIDGADYNGIIEDITLDGEVYALPFRSDFWMVFYNKDLFDRAGVPYPDNDMTVDEYFNLGYQLTSGEGSNKTYGIFNLPWTHPILNFATQDGKHQVFTDDYSMMKPYYETFLRAQKDGICMDYATMTTAGTHYSGIFYNEQAAMLYVGSWFVTMQMEKVKSGESLAKNWGIVKFPHVEGVEAGTTMGSHTTLSVNKNSKHKAEALDFIKFVSGPSGAKVLAQIGTFPALMNDEVVNTIAEADGFPQDENSKAALKPTKVYLDFPIHEKLTDFQELINEGHTDIMTENCTIDEGIERMNEKAGKLLE